MVQSPLNSYNYSIVANVKHELGHHLADHNPCKLAGLIHSNHSTFPKTNIATKNRLCKNESSCPTVILEVRTFSFTESKSLEQSPEQISICSLPYKSKTIKLTIPRNC